MCNSSYVGPANADEEEPAVTSDSPVLAGDSPAEPDEFNPGKLRSAILQSFGKLVLQACQRMGEAQEKSTFRTNDDAKTTLALVRLAPGLLQLLGEEEKAKAKEAPADKAPVPKDCPECFICSAPPGRHWAHECPRLGTENAREVLFDYKTRSLYHRKDLGAPFPRVLVPIGKNVQEWLEHNRVSERRYAASVDLRRMKEDAERVLHAANCGVASADRGELKTAAHCAKHVAEKTLEILQHCNDRFNPFLPDEEPLTKPEPLAPPGSDPRVAGELARRVCVREHGEQARRLHADRSDRVQTDLVTSPTLKEDSDDVRSQPRRVDDPGDPK